MSFPRKELCEPLNDALHATPWHMIALEAKLTQKISSDKEGAVLPLPRIVVERIPEVDPRRFCKRRGSRSHRRLFGCAALASHGRATETTKLRMARTKQNDYRENFDG